ncbi:hypothetical protein RHMOL_Rhmol10G0096500 [Rhododendron molle]|uniref:Uncharacterized protein n=1 Tax=Rhododendron molle TaxID=49168 RepID=A0ACC0M0J5_RHOML|nr:hypothetical protein RHMOL_Rhmol10G0096500 [Rhododendron molle]
MSGTGDVKDHEHVEGEVLEDSEKAKPSPLPVEGEVLEDSEKAKPSPLPVEGEVLEDSEKAMPSPQQEEEAVKKKYGGIMPKKTPLISKDHERAFFDSADWALRKQGVEKPKGPLEELRPKLQPTQQQTRYRKSHYAPSDEEGGIAPPEDAATNE